MQIIKLLILSFISTLPLCASAVGLIQSFYQGLENDLSLKQAKTVWLQSQYDDKIALAPLLPQASIQATSSKNHIYKNTSSQYETRNYALLLKQELFNPTLIATYRKEAIEKQIQHHIYQQQRQAFILNIASLYFECLLSLDNLSFSQAALKEYQFRHKQAIAQQKSGIITHTELTRIVAEVAISEANVIKAEQNIRDSLDILQQATGQSISSIATMHNTTLPFQNLQPLKKWIAQAQTHNLANLIAEKQSNLAKTGYLAAKGAFLPTISGGLQAGKQRTNNTSANHINQDTRLLKLTIQAPLVTGGSRIWQLQKGYQAVSLAKTNYEKTVADTNISIRKLYYATISGKKRIAAEKKAIEANKEVVAMNQLRHNVGAITIGDILDSIAQLHQNQLTLAKERYSFILNALNLKLQSGSICIKDLEEIDRFFSKNHRIPTFSWHNES